MNKLNRIFIQASVYIFAISFTLLLTSWQASGAQTSLALSYNFNGMVHTGEAGSPDAVNGFRSISDRALIIDGSPTSFGSMISPLSQLGYTVVNSAGVLDIIHIGDRNTVDSGIFCAGYDNYKARIARTTNLGNNWSVVLSRDTMVSEGSHIDKVFFVNSNTGFAAGYGYHQGPPYTMILLLYKTTDRGITWDSIYGFYPTIVLGVTFVNENTGFIISQASTIFKTTDMGVTWVLKSAGTANNLYDICFINEQTGFVTGCSNLILKTTNTGENWVPIQVNYASNSFLVSIYFVNQTTGYYIDIDEGWYYGDCQWIYKTTNAGSNWHQQVISPPSNLTSLFFINPDTGFAAGGDGCYFRTFNGGGPIELQNISTSVPQNYELFQNYPNPFNPNTKIKFSIPTPLNPPFAKGGTAKPGGFVKLIVYDILGKEVQSLINEGLKPGTYEVEWNAGNYPSGVYFYKLTAQDYSETKKMVLIK